jgi:hypothetical protein
MELFRLIGLLASQSPDKSEVMGEIPFLAAGAA